MTSCDSHSPVRIPLTTTGKSVTVLSHLTSAQVNDWSKNELTYSFSPDRFSDLFIRVPLFDFFEKLAILKAQGDYTHAALTRLAKGFLSLGGRTNKINIVRINRTWQIDNRSSLAILVSNLLICNVCPVINLCLYC